MINKKKDTEQNHADGCLNEQLILWIDNVWPGYHDNTSDEKIIGFFNNEKELARLNAHRNENTPMGWFNAMLAKALYERNRELYTQR